MPLLFGAFGNFLLPTQLGVHDVAFPRLNSVAFWFLPGGLIMLCQLVCLDRRYQRMNCFNIREIQTLLKARFYADLLNESSRHLFLSHTTLNLRFKLQDLNFLNLNSLLINRYGLFTGLVNRSQKYKFVLDQKTSTQTPFLTSLETGGFPTVTPYLTFIEVLNGGLVGPNLFYLNNFISVVSNKLTLYFNTLTYSLPILSGVNVSNSFDKFVPHIVVDVCNGFSFPATFKGSYSFFITKFTSTFYMFKDTLFSELN
jgi:hypothetical protein